MADQTVIPFNSNGPEDSGLVAWEAIASQYIKSGNPVQTGFEYFSTEGGRFTSGVWDCTAHELNFEPYPVDEFMIVLEGSISLKDKNGEIETFRAGDSFIIPKGTPCSWIQTEYARKFYVIHDNPESLAVASDNLAPIPVNFPTELPEVSDHDASQYLSDAPDMGMLVLYSDPDGKFNAGVWDCSPMKRVATTIPRSELMFILEGSGSITNADNVVFKFQAGDTFIVPVGMGYQWHNDEYVKKIFCSFTP